jgi:hypothetical protein
VKTPAEDALALLRAYLAAEYRADAGRIVLRIGEPIPAGAGMEPGAPVAFLTAWNPRSLARSERENRKALADLRAAIERGGAKVLDGEGVDPRGSWREPSLLAIGLDAEHADDFAREHEQNAIVAGRVGDPARLRVHRLEWRDGTAAAGLDTRFIDWVASAAAD